MSNANCATSTLLILAMALTTVGWDCGHHHDYRIYDPYYTDYHTWNDAEVGYYRQWAAENHRNPDRDFRKLAPEEQKEYWTWRHNRGDRENDHR